MNKFDFSKLNFVTLEDFLEYNDAPQYLLDNLSSYERYFKNYDWVDSVEYIRLSDAAYIGQTYNGVFSGIGMYVFDEGSIYVGEWKNGNFDGFGFYYYCSNGVVYYGEWENDQKHGKGFLWGPNHRAERIYS